MAKKSNTAKQEQQVKVEEVVQVEQPEVKQVEAIEHKVEDLMERFKTKSAVIRFLDSEGFTRSQIAKFLDIKYQFVRNVLITPVSKQAE